jgi:hypothetical protein
MTTAIATKALSRTLRATFAALLVLAVGQVFGTRPALAQAQAETQAGGAITHAPGGLIQPPPPSAPVLSWDPLRFGIALESRTAWLQDSAARRLAGRKAPVASGLSLQGDVWRRESLATVRVDLAWLTTATSTDQDFSGLREELKTDVLSLGISARHPLRPWIAPYARLVGGIGWDRLTLTASTGDLHDRQVFAQGAVGGGLHFRSPGLRLGQATASPRAGVMADVEGGYSLGSSNGFSLKPSATTSAAVPIPVSPVALGAVGRNAPYLRISVGLAF